MVHSMSIMLSKLKDGVFKHDMFMNFLLIELAAQFLIPVHSIFGRIVVDHHVIVRRRDIQILSLESILGDSLYFVFPILFILSFLFPSFALFSSILGRLRFFLCVCS